jgi:hypothetical protein
MNKKSPQASSLDLTLIKHPCDEDPKPQEVCPHIEVEPLQTYSKFSYLSDLVVSRPHFWR